MGPFVHNDFEMTHPAASCPTPNVDTWIITPIVNYDQPPAQEPPLLGESSNTYHSSPEHDGSFPTDTVGGETLQKGSEECTRGKQRSDDCLSFRIEGPFA